RGANAERARQGSWNHPICGPGRNRSIPRPGAIRSGAAALPSLTQADVEAALGSLCTGLKSFQELASLSTAGGLLRALERRLPPGAGRTLDEVAPAGLSLPSGRRLKIQYKRDQPPSAASRLQDFFGLRETLRVARGHIPIV